ncbi:MAG: HlyC/CorC family transporter [Coriobacteriia bacterium]|nr:HlyC/CorC family transporter [Coriobacteriia bacterium]
MIAVTLLVVVATLIALAAVMAVLSASEASVRLLSRSRTRRLLDAEVKGAVSLDRLAERPSRLAAAAALWRAVSYSVGSGVLCWAVLAGLEVKPQLWVVLAAAAGGVVVLFALGETLPRTLAVQNPERVGLAAAPWASRVTTLLAPIGRFFAAGWVGIASLVADEPVTDSWLTGDEYGTEFPADESAEREGAEEAFIDAVVDFATKIVREVMVPRTDMVCLEDVSSVQDAVEVIARTGMSRLPVYHDTLDDIRGVLFAKDLLPCVGSGSCPAEVGPIARQAYFVPETKPVDELLVEMRQRKTHMALVADEYGGTAGLVTIEDLLEEIVGEIFDEYDRAEPMVTELGDGELLLDARLPIDDFNDLLGTDIELEADSIGGLFVELAGHIPQPGEELEVEGVRITVRDVDGTRVRRLHVRPRAEADKESEDAEAHNGG